MVCVDEHALWTCILSSLSTCLIWREHACNLAWHGYVLCKRTCFVKVLVVPRICSPSQYALFFTSTRTHMQPRSTLLRCGHACFVSSFLFVCHPRPIGFYVSTNIHATSHDIVMFLWTSMLCEPVSCPQRACVCFAHEHTCNLAWHGHAPCRRTCFVKMFAVPHAQCLYINANIHVTLRGLVMSFVNAFFWDCVFVAAPPYTLFLDHHENTCTLVWHGYISVNAHMLWKRLLSPIHIVSYIDTSLHATPHGMVMFFVNANVLWSCWCPHYTSFLLQPRIAWSWFWNAHVFWKCLLPPIKINQLSILRFHSTKRLYHGKTRPEITKRFRF